jgi:hypothetical protein
MSAIALGAFREGHDFARLLDKQFTPGHRPRRQAGLTRTRLARRAEADMGHPLVRLAAQIDWQFLVERRTQQVLLTLGLAMQLPGCRNAALRESRSAQKRNRKLQENPRPSVASLKIRLSGALAAHRNVRRFSESRKKRCGPSAHIRL